MTYRFEVSQKGKILKVGVVISSCITDAEKCVNEILKAKCIEYDLLFIGSNGQQRRQVK